MLRLESYGGIQLMRFKSKAPVFKERRTGHPKFNYKGRATRDNSIHARRIIFKGLRSCGHDLG